MNAQTAVLFVDTNIIPDRNAGIGSLLWDLQNPTDNRPPLLSREFAFIDVGVSRARVSTVLKALLTDDLVMSVDYVATERPEAVPYANVTPPGESAKKIRGALARMISSTGAAREVENWHLVVDRDCKVSSLAYSYALHGLQVWESYFMGRPFLYSGREVEFSDPSLDEMLAPEVAKIEARIDLERKRNDDPSQPAPSWDGYRLERDPLESGLAPFGITLQKTDVPQRIKGKQNVLFLANVLNHYPQDEQARALDMIASTMEEGDLVIVQVDEVEASSIEVLRVTERGARKTRERVRWIDTRTLEVYEPGDSPGSSRQIHLKAAVDRMVTRLVECLVMKVRFEERSQEAHKALVHRIVSQVFRTLFRAFPVQKTLRIAIREAFRRLPFESSLKGFPLFKGDERDGFGGTLGSDPSPIVSEADLLDIGLSRLEPGGGRKAVVCRRSGETADEADQEKSRFLIH